MIQFKVMTFNVRGAFFGMDGDNIWENRALLNITTIKKHKPDLLGFQEYQTGNQEAYDEHLTEYDYEMGFPASMEGEYRQYNAIYWKPNLFEKLDSGKFYLSETPSEWSGSWDTAVVRAANWVKFKEKASGIEFVYLNTHLDHISELARTEGAKLIVQRLADMADLPTIVTADFNSRAAETPELKREDVPEEVRWDDMPPAGTVHTIFTQAGFKDTYLQAGHSEGVHTNTFHGFKGDGFHPVGMRIDWILTRDGQNQTFKTHSCEIVKDAQPPLYPSDHYPIVAEVTLG